ncbi:nitroreductase [Citricoccus zhacaiensis]|uniref:Nitroreductase n=1 Tax=Citricoccus zhacaiensis TaxID=489142 RepID=A0ABQ2MCR3_9MICC|nr:nitroreductase [Citricoccus zhacaiensis]GGO49585.1 nitroreductase [Citricoccus zhacaiensis]
MTYKTMTAAYPTDGAADDAAAGLERLLASRHSCRAFTPETVDRAVLQRVLAMAQRTATWCNAQPWTSYVLSGDTLERTREALTAHVTSGAEKAPDLVDPETYTAERLARRRQAGFALYGALGIGREDREARGRQHLENFRFFGAPHVVLVTLAAELREYGAVDIGAYIATLLLAAESCGLASIPQAAPALYAPALRETLVIPADKRIVATVALGYEDTAAAANAFRVPRAELGESVRFLD